MTTGYFAQLAATWEDDVTVPRPPSLPRFPTFPSIRLDEEASLTHPMPPRQPSMLPPPPPPAPRQIAIPQRYLPTIRPPKPPAHLPAVFYGLSAGVLLGAILCFAGVSFSSPTPSDDADQPVLATAGPGTTPARVHRRIPGVRVEDLPRVLVRAEDLPRAEVTDVGRRAYR